MRKRVTLLKRREDLSPDEFRHHWEFTHGPIAADFRGLERYTQNRVHPQAGGPHSGPWPVDGIVELWFNDAAGPAPGRDPDVTSQLVSDEPRFLSALSGFAVPSCDVYAPVPRKVWVLGGWMWGSPDPSALTHVCHELVLRAPELRLLQTHAVDNSERPFLRDAMAPFANPPRAFAVFEWRGEAPPLSDAGELRRLIEASFDTLLNPVQVLATDCVTIA